MKYRTPYMAVDTYTCFFFEKNMQGDIVSVYNSSGVKVIAYTYDAWGNCTASYPNGSSGITGATYNPFRYRGYYYDTDTGFYYLQSRYYNPQWGRFVNADSCLYSSMLGFNMFAYCENDPINYIDPYGESGTAIFTWWASSAWAAALAEPTVIGEIIYVSGCVILGGVALVETLMLAEAVTDIMYEANAPVPEPEAKPNDAANLPNQGEVSELPDAPPVDAGKQGKHVPGHNNNDSSKSQWKSGENGVRETQEAWKNGTPKNGKNGRVRVGRSSDGRTIEVHIDSAGRIHGYPIFP